MSALEIVLGVFLILLSVLLIAIVLMQKSREGGLSGAIAGGSDTFFGKNKGRTNEARLAKMTRYIAIVFFVLAFAATLLILFF
ncbi:MAG TPA: preprotein translocase subunit SecG [Candidatus Fimenecus excrementavium]|nr:preprotein translocase subunit SecG [Candidatus Fimenecus excrementavium]